MAFSHGLMFLHETMIELAVSVTMVVRRMAVACSVERIFKVPMELSERMTMIEDRLLVLFTFEALSTDC